MYCIYQHLQVGLWVNLFKIICLWWTSYFDSFCTYTINISFFIRLQLLFTFHWVVVPGNMLQLQPSMIHVLYVSLVLKFRFLCNWWNDGYSRYVRAGGYPIGTPYNESFPDNFHPIRDFEYHVISITNNLSSPLVLQSPQPGPWFIAAFLPKKSSEKITQKVCP